MSTNAERFYQRMKSVQSLKALLGQTEDADFDCKLWPAGSGAARGTIAKAACGFANATGGVIVIGMKASGRGPDTPDVVRELAPVANRKTVASEALEIILNFVELGIEGIRVKTIPDAGSKPSGFVIIFVPASDGPPRRSKIDWRFYLRIASGTVPMEMFQIEERFGRRPPPKLTLHIEVQQMLERSGFDNAPLRHIVFGLRNEGRGTAKFPGVRFKKSPNLKRDDFGIDGNGGFGLPWRPSEHDWIVFRGGVDDVIYPGETRMIGKLIQAAGHKADRGIAPFGNPAIGFSAQEQHWKCEAISLGYEIHAEGAATLSLLHQIDEDSITLTVPTRERAPTRTSANPWQ